MSRLEQRTELGNVQALSLKPLARIYQVTMDYLAREGDNEESKCEPATTALVGA
jgi:hypothetical protein